LRVPPILGAFRTVFLRRITALVLACAAVPLALAAREKDSTQYGVGLTVNLPFPEKEVVQVVQDVVQNGIIRGTKEYNKDEYVSGANPTTSTRVFPEWTEGGKVFYKVRLKALDPRNFKGSSDVGTLAVRYIVQAQDESHTVLRIDARFVEDFRKAAHPSDGSVENAEYKDIHDHLDAIEEMKAQAAEADKAKQEKAASVAPAMLKGETSAAPTIQPEPPASAATAEPAPSETNPVLASKTSEEQLHDLRQQVQRLVKAPGAPLKSAPFHTATTLELVPPGTEVLIVISTPYWVGIETHTGQHGWMLRDDLELVP